MLWILDYCGVFFWLTFTIVLLRLYKHFSYDYWQKLKVKSLKPVPVFGNIVDLILHRKIYHEILNDMYKALGDAPFGGVYQMRDPYLLIKDPKLVSSVLVSDFKFFSCRGPLLFFSQKPKFKGDVTMNLSQASGERWKMLRQKMSTAFTSYKVKGMYEQVSCCVAQLTEFVDKRMDASESVDIDTRNLAVRFSADVIGLCFFGIQWHAFENDYNEFVETCEQVFTTHSSNVIRLVFSVFSKRLWHKLNLTDINKKATDFFRGTVLDVVDHRRRYQETRNDFLQLVMNMQNSHENPKFAVPNNGEQVPQNGQVFIGILYSRTRSRRWKS